MQAEVLPKRQVLIVNSYHRGFKWTDEQTTAAINTLNSAFDKIEIYVEYLDTKRIYSDLYIRYLAQVFKLKYKNIKLDAIITTDDNALHFVKSYHDEIFNGAPVSFCGINNYSNFKFNKNDSFSGIVEVLDIKKTIDLVLRLLSGIEKIYVVVDNTTTGKGQLKSVIEVSQQFSDLDFIFLKGSEYSTEELLDKLHSLPKNCAVLLTVWLRDKHNIYLSEKTGGHLISNSSTVPVFGIIDMYFGYGIVGGKLLNSASHGRKAAEIAVRILNGEKASSIPVIFNSMNPYMFDNRELKRWNIDISKLPPNRIVINQTRSVYQDYKNIIWSTIITIVVLIVFVIFLTANIIKRKKSERALKENEQQLQSSNKLLQSVMNGIPDIIGIQNPDQTVRQYNQAGYNVLGMTLEEVRGKKCYELVGRRKVCDSCATTKALVSKKIEENERFEPILQKYLHCRSIPVLDDNGEVSLIVEQLRDITERKEVEDELKINQYYLTKAQEIGVIGTWEMDLRKNALKWTDENYKIFGIPLGTALTYERFLNRVHPDDIDYVNGKWNAALNKEPYDIEHRIIVDNNVKWIREKAEIEFDEEGTPILAVGFSQDITNFKQAEEQIKASLQEKETLLQEIHHRVKNNMQIIASLLRLQLNNKDKKDVDSILKENMGRVYAMAAIHESLHQSERLSEIDFKAYLQKLAQMLSQTYSVDPSKVSFQIDTPELKLAIDKANPLGLVLNELISNSLKYAFSDDPKGSINIKSRLLDGNSIEIIVADDGAGMPDGFDWRKGDSLGLKLVQNLVENQLSGSIDLDNTNGTKFTIRFNLESNYK